MIDDDKELPGPDDMDLGIDDPEEFEGDDEGIESEEGADTEVNDDLGDDAAALGDEEPRQQTRGQRHFGELRKSARESAEKAERAEREATELKQRLAALESTRTAADTAREAQAEQERLQYMSDGERAQYYAEKTQRQVQSEIGKLRFEMADATDRASFESVCSREPAIAKLRDQVERVLQQERNAGRYGANRETIANYLLGQSIRARANAAANKKGKAAAAKRQQQSSRPASGRSDVASPGRRGGETMDALEKRLAGIKI
jgi:hypothetical protein